MLGIIKQSHFYIVPEKLQVNKKNLAPSWTTKIETKDSATNIVPEIGSHQFGYPLSKTK